MIGSLIGSISLRSHIPLPDTLLSNTLLSNTLPSILLPSGLLPSDTLPTDTLPTVKQLGVGYQRVIRTCFRRELIGRLRNFGSKGIGGKLLLNRAEPDNLPTRLQHPANQWPSRKFEAVQQESGTRNKTL